MSFASDLKKVSNLDEAQKLFESEVFRISKLSLYRKSKASYNNRVLKIQTDIYNHLNDLNIVGILYFYDYMQYERLVRLSSNDGDFTLEDAKFFKRLWIFLAIYSVCFIGVVIYSNHFVKPVSNIVSRETISRHNQKQTSNNSENGKSNNDNDDSEVVYNKYRSQNTTKKILKEDEAWANR